jgi:hypothetical protein
MAMLASAKSTPKLIHAIFGSFIMSKVVAWPENYKFAVGQSTQLTHGFSGKTNGGEVQALRPDRTGSCSGLKNA